MNNIDAKQKCVYCKIYYISIKIPLFVCHYSFAVSYSSSWHFKRELAQLKFNLNKIIAESSHIHRDKNGSSSNQVCSLLNPITENGQLDYFY